MLHRYVIPEAVFIRNGPCPRCKSNGADRAGDNLAIYSDGHAYCFSCKFYDKGYAPPTLGTGSQKDNRFNGIANATNDVGVSGTSNEGQDGRRSQTFGGEALKYLKSYGITAGEIETYGIELTEDSITYHFLQEDGGELLQTRRFLPDGSRQFSTKGSARKLRKIWGKKETGTTVIVEDAISAIKVGRVYGTYPVCGSNIDTNTLQTLCKRSNEVVVWLDSDKRSEALQTCFKGWQWNPKVRPVFTANDPKDYTELIIEQVVQDALKTT